MLVGYVETENFQKSLAGMAAWEVNARWQKEMSEFFMNAAGVRPDQAMTPLEEVFHLD
jgi:L-rhamnose mutarotase